MPSLLLSRCCWRAGRGVEKPRQKRRQCKETADSPF